MKRMGRGVLDRPAFAGHDGGGRRECGGPPVPAVIANWAPCSAQPEMAASRALLMTAVLGLKGP